LIANCRFALRHPSAEPIAVANDNPPLSAKRVRSTHRTICGSQWIPPLNMKNGLSALVLLSVGSIGYRKWFCGLSTSLSLKGTNSIAGGNAPRQLADVTDPERVVPVDKEFFRTDNSDPRFDPFRVGYLLRFNRGRCPRLLNVSLSGTREEGQSNQEAANRRINNTLFPINRQ
jgi:hypothetical protein